MTKEIVDYTICDCSHPDKPENSTGDIVRGVEQHHFSTNGIERQRNSHVLMKTITASLVMCVSGTWLTIYLGKHDFVLFNQDRQRRFQVLVEPSERVELVSITS